MTITQAEIVIMKCLWVKSPKTAEEIVQEIAVEQGWLATTVRTLINRLLKKDVIAAERSGRKYLYTPKISQEDFAANQSKNLLDQLFDGQLAPFVSHFSKHNKLSEEDVFELKKLMEHFDERD